MTTIDSIEWGKITINGQIYKDVMITPKGVYRWNWDDHFPPTRHQPGIQKCDISPLLHDEAHVLVLSRGMENKLHLDPETQSFLEVNQITYFCETTPEAVALYNSLIDRGHQVGALIHSTC